MRKISISIQGMHCGGCSKLVEMNLKDAGASSAKVDFDSKKAVVEFDDGKTTQERLLKAVQESGYKASVSS
ncbi:MAG TPA: heavy-metal-associated domain-containing protein [archaeon]|nr:heavy-metal-associated domain-containing protein [archaeon]